MIGNCGLGSIGRGHLGLVLLLAVLPFTAQTATGDEPQLDDFFERWIAAVEPLLIDEERQLFAGLESDLERELFVRRFWAEREGVAPGLWARRWWRHFAEGSERWEASGDVRTETLLTAGRPVATTVFGGCSDVIRPLEVWRYDPPVAGIDARFFVFYQQGSQVHRWLPGARPADLMFGDSDRWTLDDLVVFGEQRGCWRARYGPAVDVGEALARAADFEALRNHLTATVDRGWPGQARAAGLGDRLAVGPLGLEFVGRYQRKTIVRGRVAVPVVELERNAEGHLFDRLRLRGDVWLGTARRGRLVDAFTVDHYVAGFLPSDDTIELDFYRRLRPDVYTLDLRLEDTAGRALLREQRTFEVAEMEAEAEPPAGYAKGFAGLTRSEVGVVTTFPSVELLRPEEELLVGEVDFEAVTAGGPIQGVDFVLDGAVTVADDQPPYAARIDLGPDPDPRTLEAIARDPAGRELARDVLELNASAPRFAVRLLEPLRGTRGRRARAMVDLPAETELESVEFFLGDQRFARLTEPPFVHNLPEHRPSRGGIVFVRVVATATVGEAASRETAEDVVLIDLRHPVDTVDVQLVELYTSVLDTAGRPVRGLPAEAFRIFEDGQAKPMARFDTVENLAINVALMMDVSSSMRRRIALAARSARQFFETVLTPGDQVSLLTFSHTIDQVVPFTGDTETLLAESAGFNAWGTTRLWDSLIFTLHSFGGLEGKRALVLLSDGHDVDSDFGHKQVLEAARRSRVAIYPIVLGVEQGSLLEELEALAEDSGGSLFVISSISELDRVYRRIEEDLRSQYLLVYEADPREVRRELRAVRVEVEGDGLRARTLHGYYP